MPRQLLSGFSDHIDLARFEKEARRRLYRGFLFAFMILTSLVVLWPSTLREVYPVREEPYRTIRADIIEMPPRSLSEPYRFRPPARSRGMIFHRQFVPGQPSGIFSAKPPVLPEVRGPSFRTDIDRVIDHLAGRYSDTLNVDGALPRGPSDRIPLRRDAGNDPGMFRADIIYNPDNKMAAQGYVHIPLLRIEYFEQTEKYVLSLRGLTKGISRLTNISAILDNPLEPIRFHTGSRHFLQIKEEIRDRGISVDSLFVRRPPFIYILTDRPITINEAERASLRSYLSGGNGVLLLESAMPGNEALRRQLKSFLGYIFECPGCIKPALEPVPRNHLLYHCFFDFENGPPQGAGQNFGAVTHKEQPYLEGMWLNGRLVALYSDFGYGLCWASEGNHDEQLKIGVNLVLYSLVQQKARRGHQALSFR
jgi:hypothetical protein